MKKIIWGRLVVLALVFIVLFSLPAPRGHLPTAITIDQISFDRPAEFIFEKKSDELIELRLRPDIANILNFEGEIRLFRDYDHYKEAGFLPSYVRDSSTGITRLIDHTNSFADLLAIAGKETNHGDDIVEIGHSDAGSLRIDYLINLSDPENDHIALLNVRKWTYEGPNAWGTGEIEVEKQRRMLEASFRKITRSAVYGTSNQKEFYALTRESFDYKKLESLLPVKIDGDNPEQGVIIEHTTWSPDGQQVFVTLVTEDRTQERGGFDGLYPILPSSRQYLLCNLSEDHCEFSETFRLASQLALAPNFWVFFDPTNQRLIGKMASEMRGLHTPLATYDLTTGIISLAGGYELNEYGGFPIMPNGYTGLSPSLSKAILYDRTNHQILLYRLDNTEKPSGIFALDNIIPSVDEVRWSPAEDKILLIAYDHDGRWLILDLNNGEIK